MRLIADESLESDVVRALREEGHDVQSIAEGNKRAPDTIVLGLAARSRRILVTNDKDFAQLAFLFRRPAEGIVLVRMPDSSPESKARRVAEALRGAAEPYRGAMTIIEPGSVRHRPLPKSRA